MSSAPLKPSKPPRVAFGVWKRGLLGAVLLFLCTGGAVATAALLQVKQASDIFSSVSAPLEGFKGPTSPLDDVSAGQPQTLMLLGSDRRYADGKVPGNSDTIVLVRLDPDKGATAIMSVPRDLMVDIPGVGRSKINAAYAEGGPALTTRVVRSLFGDRIAINHVVNVNFGGFQRLVNRLGCVYTDVDRKYFNDNAPPVDSPTDYAVIDVKAGYQKLCGKQALQYVRFRHLDSDIVRGARQQDFLRQAKDQIGVARLISDRDNLIRIFGRYTQTDIRGETAILRLIKLGIESAKNPLQEVRFDLEDDPDNPGSLLASQSSLDDAAEQFLNAKGSTGTRGKVAKKSSDRSRAASRQRKEDRSSSAASVPPGLFADPSPAEDLGARLELKTPFPVYYPKWADTGLKSYDTVASRTYSLRGTDNKVYRAYRIVAPTAGTGNFYGVQGTNWQDPPILDGAQKRRDKGGRTFEVIGDGSKYRLVAWRTPNAVYWISNTLQLSLSNSQMLGIARSLTRVGQ